MKNNTSEVFFDFEFYALLGFAIDLNQSWKDICQELFNLLLG